MPFAIRRMKRREGGAIRAIEAHNERTKESHKNNLDIRLEKAKENYYIIRPKHRYSYEVQSRIKRNTQIGMGQKR